ncbi:MAG: hypothetical protein KC502_18670 [Myxococcales bacterium]|nr:hypothetical protein [Myxococcales bacterium]
MHVRDVQVHNAPGLPGPLALRRLPPGLVVLLGPNASGKSTIGRILRGLLWPKMAPAFVHAQSTWLLGEADLAAGATLVAGHVQWEGEAPGVPAHCATPWQLTLQELLRAEASSDQAIAQEVMRQLHGGYDLAALRVTPKRRPNAKLLGKQREATLALRRALDDTDTLAAREAQLAALRAQEELVNQAPARLAAVEQALRICEWEDELARTQEAMAHVPAAAKRLPEDATVRFEALTEAVTRKESEQAVQRKKVDKIRDQRADLAFDSGDPGAEAISAWVRAAQRITTDSAHCRHLTTQAQDAAARARSVIGQVWDRPAVGDLPGRAALESLATSSAALAAAQAELLGLQRLQAQTQSRVVATPLPAAERSALETERSLLGEWLTAVREREVSATIARRTPLAAGLLALGVMLLAAGVGLGLAGPAWASTALLLLGVGCAGVAAGLLVGPKVEPPTLDGNAFAGAIEERYRAAGFGALSVDATWTHGAVAARRTTLDSDIQRDGTARQHLADQQALAAMAATTGRTVDARHQELADAAEAYGLSTELPGLALHVQAERLITLAEALADAARTEALAEHARSDLRQLRLALGGELRQLRGGVGDGGDGSDGGTTAALVDPAALSSAVQLVADQRSAWLRASQQLNDANERLRELAVELQTATAARDAFLDKCGLHRGAAHTLAALEEAHQTWVKLENLERGLTAQIERTKRPLPTDLPSAKPALQAEKARLQQLSDSSVQDDIIAIEASVRAAMSGTTVADAVAARTKAQDTLAANCLTVQATHARASLLAWLQSDFDHTPALLARARQWLLRFTQDRYELRLDTDGRFGAVDLVSQRRQSLGELSAGTRVQLLLAARLAYLEHAEQDGPPLPLFLDEVLSTADPDRFGAVADAVLELAAGGRQVFYATPDPNEVAAWQARARDGDFPEPFVASLTDQDTTEAWAAGPTSVQVQPRLPFPAALASDLSGLIAARGWARPQLYDPVERWPLLLLLFDHPEAAWRAAEASLSHVGQLQVAAQQPAPALPAALLSLASTRAFVVRHILSQLRIGRDRPITWADISASGAVSKTFEHRARDIVSEHGHQPAVALTRISEISRFPRKKAEELAAHLVDSGVISEVPVMTDIDVVQRVGLACKDMLATGKLALQQIEALTKLTQDIVLTIDGEVAAGGRS